MDLRHHATVECYQTEERHRHQMCDCPPGEHWRFDPDRTYPMPKPDMKPRGLWLSVDNDWRRWCEGDGMEDWVRGPEYGFEFIDAGRVLMLTTAQDIDRFTDAFVNRHPEDDGMRRWYEQREITRNSGNYIDQYRLNWGVLASEFAGILIAPYIWERRLSPHTSWYYPWDAASACIWDLSVLRCVGPVATLALEAANEHA